MDSDSVCNHRSDKQNRTTAKRESDFFCLTCQSLWISGCCYGYFDHFCDYWISWVDLLWFATLTVWLQMSDYSQLSDYIVRLQLYRMISEKWSSECINNTWGICYGYDYGGRQYHIHEIQYVSNKIHPSACAVFLWKVNPEQKKTLIKVGLIYQSEDHLSCCHISSDSYI